MTHRIITHASCMDGFCSAFVFKKYLAQAFGVNQTKLEVIGLKPNDIETETIKIERTDIILDLPPAKTPFFCWIDHHTSNRDAHVKAHHQIWKATPSCTGLLCDIAQEKQITLPAAVKEFRHAIDIIDSAAYNFEDYKECYYPPQNPEKLSLLQKLHAIDAVFSTGDFQLNQELFSFLLQDPLPTAPQDLFDMHKLWIERFYKARLQSYQEWRTNIDTYMHFDTKSHCVIQDDRKAKVKRGLPDRFYVFAKHRNAIYSINIKVVDETVARIGIGTNIFEKPTQHIDVGATCKEVGKKFGQGSGGGHKVVGGCEVLVLNVDAALEFILEKMRNGN